MMNGSRSAVDTPAKVRRTGNPSPSKPLGAVVIERTERERFDNAALIRGSVNVSAVTAGLKESF